MSSSPALAAEKKHWWLSNSKIVEKYIKDARVLVATREHSEIVSALNLLEAALAVSPHLEAALELKARCLLYLRRFKDVADMLQDYIPSFNVQTEDASSDTSSQPLSRDRVKLLSASDESSSSRCKDGDRDYSFKCFSVSDLKKKVLARLCKSCEKEGPWRYLVLGQACCHLGLMEDAMVLLQTGKRLASAAFRRQSVCLSDDSFILSDSVSLCREPSNNTTAQPSSTASESGNVSNLLGQTKLLLRRRAAALAALDAGVHAEAIRHFSKILDSRRNTPQGFLAECYIHRAGAYRAAGRVAEAIADCNRTLALDPTSIPALSLRATLLESIRSFPDCLRDLEHLKLLYDTILRDRKLPGPAWKRHNVRYREVAGRLRDLTTKIQGLRQRIGSGEACGLDYHALIGLRRGCSRTELERAHLLLTLKHRPDKATGFIDRCEFVDDRDVDVVKDQARMSALILYRLLQKGYSSLMLTIMDEEAAEKHRQRVAIAAASAQALVPAGSIPKAASSTTEGPPKIAAAVRREDSVNSHVEATYGGVAGCELPAKASASSGAASSAIQGVFCRDVAVVEGLLSQVGFNHPIPLKYEALSC